MKSMISDVKSLISITKIIDCERVKIIDSDTRKAMISNIEINEQRKRKSLTSNKKIIDFRLKINDFKQEYH